MSDTITATAAKPQAQRIAMLGAGSGFTINIAHELAASRVLAGATLVLMDLSADRLARAEQVVRKIFEEAGTGVRVESVTDLESALRGCGYVIASCERNRYPYWVKDVDLPRRHGVHQYTGENGGPGGQIHSLRNIAMFQPILKAMERLCPDAWMLNFTNPMSFLCTYFKNYSPIRAMGFCHQVHGSFGVIAEMLGMEPGDLQVISGGVNHFNWLLDIRRRGTNRSCMREFFEQVRASKYWKERFHGIPEQTFTLEILNTFDAYCIGYDDHIVEYLPFFYEESEWADHPGHESILTRRLIPTVQKGDSGKALEYMALLPDARAQMAPFPKNDRHPYYAEKPCAVIEALETNEPLYLDAVNIVNHGSISNLPADAIVDIPAVVVGGMARGIHVGALPVPAAELCRRQITLHEMIAQAAHEGNEKLVVQALCLDPYVHSITQARNIWADFRKEFRDELPMFA